MGLFSPKPEVIQARRFEVIDENGKTRALIDDKGIRYCDMDGNLAITIEVAPAGPNPDRAFPCIQVMSAPNCTSTLLLSDRLIVTEKMEGGLVEASCRYHAKGIFHDRDPAEEEFKVESLFD